MRRPKVLISAELLKSLDRGEIEGVLAHELAHLSARDVQLVLVAGLLRDIVAWNPFAYIAYGHLRRDRELAADRCAAATTGRPLALASGLLKVARSMKARRSALDQWLTFFGSRRAVSTRVAQLLAVADGKSPTVPAGRLPYVVAALLSIALGLQVGAQFGRQDAGALAIMWGAQDTDASAAWAPKAFVKHPTAQAGQGAEARDRRSRRSSPVIDRYPKFASGVPVKRGHFDEWIVAMNRWSRRLGVSGLTLRWEARSHWEAVPLVTPDAIWQVGIFRMEARAGP
jgi:hypothetical protein